MSTESTPQVTMVPVKRYDVNLTLDDILTPLTAKEGTSSQAGPGAAANPELAQHLQALSALAGQLKDVVSKINQIDPTMLAPTPGQPPKA
ncbi:MAG: hypothetical protein ACR2JY_15195 [Chloroflexota bacterium]